MNQYETVFIMNPVLSEDQVKETVTKYTNFLSNKKSKIVSEEDWGLKKLKYSIQNKKSGFYFLIEHQSEGATLSEMNVEFKRDEAILRWLTVKLDKYAIEYASRRRKKINLNSTKKETK